MDIDFLVRVQEVTSVVGYLICLYLGGLPRTGRRRCDGSGKSHVCSRSMDRRVAAQRASKINSEIEQDASYIRPGQNFEASERE